MGFAQKNEFLNSKFEILNNLEYRNPNRLLLNCLGIRASRLLQDFSACVFRFLGKAR